MGGYGLHSLLSHTFQFCLFLKKTKSFPLGLKDENLRNWISVGLKKEKGKEYPYQVLSM